MDPHNGRCLGKFLAVSAETESFGAATVTLDDEFFITADSDGYVKARSFLCYNNNIDNNIEKK